MHSTRLNHKTFLFHILFWIVYFISNSYLWQTFNKTYNETTYYGLTRLPVKILAVYINLYLLNQFFFQKRYFAFFGFFLLNLIAAGFYSNLYYQHRAFSVIKTSLNILCLFVQ